MAPSRIRVFVAIAACLFIIVTSLMMQTLSSESREERQSAEASSPSTRGDEVAEDSRRLLHSSDTGIDRDDSKNKNNNAQPGPDDVDDDNARPASNNHQKLSSANNSKKSMSTMTNTKRTAPAPVIMKDDRDPQSIADFEPETEQARAKRLQDWNEFSKLMATHSDRDTGIEVEGEGGAEIVVKEHDSAYQMLQIVNPMRRSPLVPPGGICPLYRQKFGKDADSKTSINTIYKYSQYTNKYCNTTGMLQMHFGLPQFLRFFDTVAGIVKLKPGMRIFDLGSGCGTMLNYYQLKYGTIGTGIDLTNDAVAHSRWHGRPNQAFCRLDATQLRFFPSNHYDAIVSWAVLYHVRRTWVQCAIVTQLARMLKPGASMYIGHLRTEKTQLFWKRHKCKIPGTTWWRMLDYVTFKVVSFRRHGFFSVFLKKLTEEELKQQKQAEDAQRANSRAASHHNQNGTSSSDSHNNSNNNSNTIKVGEWRNFTEFVTTSSDHHHRDDDDSGDDVKKKTDDH